MNCGKELIELKKGGFQMNFAEKFSELKSKKKAALIPFFVLGDPDQRTSLALIRRAFLAGADALELGLPFSDPIADGKTIQAADQRSLQNGMNSLKAFQLIKELRKFADLPIGLMVYFNLVHALGIESFYRKARDAGVNAVLVVDCPLEESGELLQNAVANKLEQIFLVSPETNNKRLNLIASKSSGFLYLVSLLGVTGARKSLSSEAKKLIQRAKKSTKIPLCLGFGISKPLHVRKAVSLGTDGVIVGSAIAKLIEKNLSNKKKMLKEVKEFISRMNKETKI